MMTITMIPFACPTLQHPVSCFDPNSLQRLCCACDFCVMLAAFGRKRLQPLAAKACSLYGKRQQTLRPMLAAFMAHACSFHCR